MLKLLRINTSQPQNEHFPYNDSAYLLILWKDTFQNPIIKNKEKVLTVLALKRAGFVISCHNELENHSRERSNLQSLYTTTNVLQSSLWILSYIQQDSEFKYANKHCELVIAYIRWHSIYVLWQENLKANYTQWNWITDSYYCLCWSPCNYSNLWDQCVDLRPTTEIWTRKTSWIVPRRSTPKRCSSSSAAKSAKETHRECVSSLIRKP